MTIGSCEHYRQRSTALIDEEVDLRLVVPRTPLPFRHAGREGRCANGTGNGSRERARSTRRGFASTTNRLATGLVRHEGG